MNNPMGDSPASHEGTDPPTLRQQFDALLCEYNVLAEPGLHEYDKMLDDMVNACMPIGQDQLSIYIANTAHLVLYKLRKEMHAEINKHVDRLRIDHEKRWEQTLAQVKDLVRMETTL